MTSPGAEPTSYESKILETLRLYDRAAVTKACDELIDHLYSTDSTFPEREARSILRSLRHSRLFEVAEKLGDALIISGSVTPSLRRLHALTLMDLGRLSTVLPYVQDAEKLAEGETLETQEIRGLRGRAFKLQYLRLDPRTNRAAAALMNAIDCYRGAVEDDRMSTSLWFNINVAALLCRASRDGVSLPAFPSPEASAKDIARRILEFIEESSRGGTEPVWDLGIASEACLVLERFEDALRWLVRYATSPDLTVAELDGMNRQLNEVWGLGINSDPGSSLLPVIWGALLYRTDGALSIRPEELKPGPLLQHLAEARRETASVVDYLSTAARRAEALLSVTRPDGRIQGTGILIRGTDFDERFGPDPLLLTSYRVVSEQPAIIDALRPDEAILTSARLQAPLVKCELAQILWSSSPRELGVSLLRLRGDVGTLRPLSLNERRHTDETAASAYLIGRPSRTDPSFSIQQTHLLHSVENHVHYRSFHEELLPGAALFDTEWNLVGVHVSSDHSCASCRGLVHQGTIIQAIRQALRTDFSDAGEVFFCYARRNEVFVLQLAEALRQKRVRVWLDQWSIPASANWDAEIDRALQRCSRFVIVLSPQAVESDEVRSELRVALDERKPVIPILHQACSVPRQLRRTQYIDLSRRDRLDEESVGRVLEALRSGTVSEPAA